MIQKNLLIQEPLIHLVSILAILQLIHRLDILIATEFILKFTMKNRKMYLFLYLKTATWLVKMSHLIIPANTVLDTPLELMMQMETA